MPEKIIEDPPRIAIQEGNPATAAGCPDRGDALGYRS
jgi:hypothetical protein